MVDPTVKDPIAVTEYANDRRSFIMTIETSDPEGSQPADRAGIYNVPYIGRPLGKVRDIADSLEPTPEDSRGVRAGKRLVQGSAVAAATGVAMIAVL